MSHGNVVVVHRGKAYCRRDARQRGLTAGEMRVVSSVRWADTIEKRQQQQRQTKLRVQVVLVGMIGELPVLLDEPRDYRLVRTADARQFRDVWVYVDDGFRVRATDDEAAATSHTVLGKVLFPQVVDEEGDCRFQKVKGGVRLSLNDGSVQQVQSRSIVKVIKDSRTIRSWLFSLFGLMFLVLVLQLLFSEEGPEIYDIVPLRLSSSKELRINTLNHNMAELMKMVTNDTIQPCVSDKKKLICQTEKFNLAGKCNENFSAHDDCHSVEERAICKWIDDHDAQLEDIKACNLLKAEKIRPYQELIKEYENKRKAIESEVWLPPGMERYQHS